MRFSEPMASARTNAAARHRGFAAIIDRWRAQNRHPRSHHTEPLLGGLTTLPKQIDRIGSRCIYWPTAPVEDFMARANGSSRARIADTKTEQRGTQPPVYSCLREACGPITGRAKPSKA